MITPKPNLVKGQLGNGPLVNKPTWNPTIRDNGSIGNVSTWIMFYWKLHLAKYHLGIRGLPAKSTPPLQSSYTGRPGWGQPSLQLSQPPPPRPPTRSNTLDIATVPTNYDNLIEYHANHLSLINCEEKEDENPLN